MAKALLERIQEDFPSVDGFYVELSVLDENLGKDSLYEYSFDNESHV